MPSFKAFNSFADLFIILLAIAQIIGFVAETASKFFFKPNSFKQVSA